MFSVLTRIQADQARFLKKLAHVMAIRKEGSRILSFCASCLYLGCLHSYKMKKPSAHLNEFITQNICPAVEFSRSCINQIAFELDKVKTPKTREFLALPILLREELVEI